jgi:hypothetical protein
MQYLLLIYSNESAMQKAPKEAVTEMHGAYMSYTEAMKKAGVLSGASGCSPPRRRPRCGRPAARPAC